MLSTHKTTNNTNLKIPKIGETLGPTDACVLRSGLMDIVFQWVKGHEMSDYLKLKKNPVLCNVLKLNMPLHNNEGFYWLTERRRVNKNIVCATQGSDSETNAGLHEPKPGDTWHLEVQGNMLSFRACRNGQCLKTWSF